MTFDLDLWPTDLNINRGHLLIKDYLPTTLEASGAKCSWVISCTRWSRLAWPLTLTFDLMTWISIGVFYSSRTIYLPSLKLLGHSWIISCTRLRDTDIPTDRHTCAKQYAPPFSKGGINIWPKLPCKVTCFYTIWCLSVFFLAILPPLATRGKTTSV